jgi:hypothetical protein
MGVTVKPNQFISDVKQYRFHRIKQLDGELLFNLIMELLSHSDNEVSGLVVDGLEQLKRQARNAAAPAESGGNSVCDNCRRLERFALLFGGAGCR